MELTQLQTLLQSVEPAALLVEPRVLRRVIRIDRRMQGFRLVIPHESSYTIDRDRLLAFVELDELAVSPGSDLPRRLILLPQPDENERTNDAGQSALLDRYRRTLFHACVHLELENRRNRNQPDEEWASQRREQIGEVEFDEIHGVLQKEDLLFHAPSDLEIYIEFAAVALELTYFAPRELINYFPAIRDWDAIAGLLKQDIDAERLYERLRIAGLVDARDANPSDRGQPQDEWEQKNHRVSLAGIRKLQSKASQAANVGNSIKSALIHQRISRIATQSSYEKEALAAADRELSGFTKRWQKVLKLPRDDERNWYSALKPLMNPAAEGLRSNEARLLHDLQKVCIEQERGIYRLDLVGWVRTLGKRPIRRPLPLMQDVLTLRHLRTARRRAALARITPDQQSQLVNLIDHVLPRVEARAREKLRTIINGVFDGVGFTPSNVLETVARRKLVEELLDRIVEQSYLTMTDLRDAISKNDLKLADVTQLSELITGDYVLQADRRFDTALDGVYRRGSVYLRWPQMLSSLVFGTNLGRILTKRLVVPFGGAFLLLEFLHHLGLFGKRTPTTVINPLSIVSGEIDDGVITSDPTATLNDPSRLESTVTAEPLSHDFSNSIAESTTQSDANWMFWSSVVLLGTWLSLIIQRPEFRAWNVAFASSIWRLIRHVVVELPSNLVNSEWVRQILESRAFSIVRSYVLEPGASAGLIALATWLVGWPISGRGMLEVFLATALFLNSPIGRYVSERTFDFLMRVWLELKMQVFTAIFRAIVDLFDRLATLLSRVVYTVDDWLRFRAGDHGLMQGVKLAGGVVWFFVSYVIVFVFTLLVEPQVNPIKHFPVVTVSHKLILPFGPQVAHLLTPYLGGVKAQTLVWTTIWLVPGVFGFLVWELKENWRLYAANRSPRLGPQAIGHHGETMLRLLRIGFHSGTLPKAFASLRRPARKEGVWAEGRLQRKRAVITHAEEAVQHFVERELVALLDEVGFPHADRLTIGPVHAATNRIDVAIHYDNTSSHCPPVQRADASFDSAPEFGQPARLTWEYYDGQLIGEFDPPPWLDSIAEVDRQTFIAALEKLFQRSGVDLVRGPRPLLASPHRDWADAVAYWNAE